MILNFKKRFEQYVTSGSKRHTIRAKRKIPGKVGQLCHCYTGLRQKGARLLGRWPCTRIEEITIIGKFRSGVPLWLKVAIGDQELSPSEVEALCWRDGFRESDRQHWYEFAEFWYKEHRDSVKPSARDADAEDELPLPLGASIKVTDHNTLTFHGDLIHWDYDHPAAEKFKPKGKRKAVAV